MEVKAINQKMKIKVSNTPINDGIVSCKKVKIRERLLNKLFGPVRKVTIIVPGDSVKEISIIKKPDKKEGKIKLKKIKKLSNNNQGIRDTWTRCAQ